MIKYNIRKVTDMNINDELEKIKTKYFSTCNTYNEEVIKVIKELMKSIPDTSKIAIRGGGEHTLKLLELIPNNKNIIGIFDINNAYTNNTGVIKSYPVSDLIKYDIDIIIISSFKYRYEIRKELENNFNKSYIIIDIYDKLAEKGIVLDRVFYFYTAYPYCEISDLKLKLDNTKEKKQREKLLINIIEKCIDIKDFISFKKYIEKYKNEKFNNTFDYNSLKKDIDTLLQQIIEVLKYRKHKDIILSWNDAIPYEELDKLPYLKKLSENSLFFENSYTVTPYTDPTFKAMFSKKWVWNNNTEKDKKTFNLFKEIEKNGYHPIWIGNDRNWVKDYANDGLECDMTTVWGPSTIRYWQMLYYLMKYDEPLFVCVHAVVETHEPYLSPDVLKPEFPMKAYRDDYKTEKILSQIETSINYWNQQLEFYDKFIQNYNCSRIYMSDHGTWLNLGETRYAEKAIHNILFIQDKSIKNCRCKELFSLYNFKEMLEYIINNNKKNYKAMFSNEIFIQDVEIFDRDIINILKKYKETDLSLSFCGIITKKLKYIVLSNGKEKFFKKINGNFVEIYEKNGFDILQKKLQKFKNLFN